MTEGLRASCLCGGVRYTLSAAADTLNICYCHQRRRANGSAFHAVLVVPVDSVTFDGSPAITEYQSSPGKFRAFCASCGSPLYSRRDDAPDLYRLRAGLIEELPAPIELSQQHRAETWPWLNRVAALIGHDQDGAAS